MRIVQLENTHLLLGQPPCLYHHHFCIGLIWSHGERVSTLEAMYFPSSLNDLDQEGFKAH